MSRPIARLTRLIPKRHISAPPARAVSTVLHQRPPHAQLPRRTLPAVSAPLTAHRTLFIQTHATPNPSSLKFHPGTPLLPAGSQHYEFTSGRTSHNSPLARKLFGLDHITSVLISPEFITITLDGAEHWPYLKPEIFSLITEHLSSGQPVVLETSSEGPADTRVEEGDSEVVAMIKELLDTRVRPAIQEDGGDIEYKGFDEATGTVKVQLRGACRTCDSSTATLKQGIESMLMHYIEEVKAVEQVLGEEEKIAISEFEKFEEKLRKVKGEKATASSPLDTVDPTP